MVGDIYYAIGISSFWGSFAILCFAVRPPGGGGGNGFFGAYDKKERDHHHTPRFSIDQPEPPQRSAANFGIGRVTPCEGFKRRIIFIVVEEFVILVMVTYLGPKIPNYTSPKGKGNIKK